MAPEDTQYPRAGKSADPGGKIPSTDAAAGQALTVEVAYATPGRQVILRLQVPPGTTAAQAVDASGVRQQFADIGSHPQLGIFSCKIPLDHVLASGDRVEIYRPLLLDPKQSRREKAELQRRSQRQSEQQRANKHQNGRKKHP
jgi:putative ubiquitin-RnfH superfamily antitoxin RatB of RatAB toxin-antitoxin module